MLGDLASSKCKPQSRSRIARPGVLYVAMVLALTMAGPGSASAVHAAPPLDAVPFTLKINMPRGLLCANHDYSVFVTPRLGGGDVTTSDGKNHELVEFRPEAVAIEAFSQNASVATISPKRAVSGWDVEGFDTSAARFSLHTAKAGTTRVYFEAAYGGQYAGPGVDVQVVNCRYKITIRGRAAGSGDNIFLTQVYTATGEIGGDPGAALTGDAQVTWQMRQAGDCYTATTTTPPSIAHMNGTLNGDGDTLTVKVSFDPLTVSNTVRAAGICARSGATATKQGQIQPPPLGFTVSGAGGSDSLPFVFSDGVVTLAGTATFRAIPLAAK